MKKAIISFIEGQKQKMVEMSDNIFDRPESGGEEFFASELLTGYLRKQGFEVERGLAGLPTAFRAVYETRGGGPSIGLLCEYDALPGFGHGCAHHMQGPAVVGAAAALKRQLKGMPFRLVVYGTPAEESSRGKIPLLEAGYFQDIDVALMAHGGPETTVDVKSLALCSYRVRFHGVAAHAAIKPEAGRSALDALLLSFNAVEYLREHVREDVKMHYAIRQTSPLANVVPDFTEASFTLRSFNSEYLSGVCDRFINILKGAALMTDTTYEVEKKPPLDSKIPVHRLNDVLMDNARQIGAPNIIPFRERTGSTDFGNVLHKMPGSCIRVSFVPPGTSSHSQVWLDAGKSDKLHQAILYAAEILAMSAYDLITSKKLLQEIKNEFELNLAESKQ